MTVNQEAFREIHSLILQFPMLHRQQSWETGPEHTGLCGTTRCIAGWATWLKARELGLLSQKREMTSEGIRDQVAGALGLEDSEYETIGRVVLGLNPEQANDLFWDMNKDRVVARVESYAVTGEDISDRMFDSYDMD